MLKNVKQSSTRDSLKALLSVSLLAALITGLLWLDEGEAKTENAAPVAESPREVQKSSFEKKWGVRVTGIRLTAAGYMMDFRYRILDAEKAAKLLDRKIRPLIVVEKSGRKLQVPVSAKIGPLRQSAKFAKVNRDYFILFANPGKHVNSGDKVSITIGDFEVSHLVVQ